MRRTAVAPTRALLGLGLLSVALAACQPEAPSTDGTATGPTTAGAEAETAGPADAGPAAPAGFDVEAVPVSDAALGDFPYFDLPEGYGNPNRPVPVRDFDRVAVWTGDRLEWVEGRIFESFVQALNGKGWSRLEVVRNLDHQVRQAGGVKVTESKPSKAAIEQWDGEQAYSEGRGDIYNAEVATWLVRRADRDIWLHFVGDTAGGSWMVIESAPFEPTAALRPASELKQQLDVDGKVALQVNFATDKAEILPESRPQIDEVVQLLQDDPGLELSVDGHTDSTGDAARNMALSEARAASVVAALASKGIDPGRLQAKGYGQTQPVADNGSEAGKAKNRRVELVRQ